MILNYGVKVGYIIEISRFFKNLLNIFIFYH
jgi:hypothetical protein